MGAFLVRILAISNWKFFETKTKSIRLLGLSCPSHHVNPRLVGFDIFHMSIRFKNFSRFVKCLELLSLTFCCDQCLSSLYIVVLKSPARIMFWSFIVKNAEVCGKLCHWKSFSKMFWRHQKPQRASAVVWLQRGVVVSVRKFAVYIDRTQSLKNQRQQTDLINFNNR